MGETLNSVHVVGIFSIFMLGETVGIGMTFAGARPIGINCNPG